MTANQPAAPTERTRVRRRPQRGHYDRTTIDAILDGLENGEPPAAYLIA